MRLFQTIRPNKQGNMLFFRATWSHLYRSHFFFARHTLSQMSHAALGLLLEKVPVSLFTQLPWFLLPMLSLSDMCRCKSWTFGRRLIEVVVTLVLCRTASFACMTPIGHHRHWLTERHMLSATTRPAARYSRLKGCQVPHMCYLLLPKLTPFKKFSSSTRGLLTGTSWDWHIFPLHAWK